MRFNRKNPKFMVDVITLIFAVTVIILAIIAIMDGPDTILAMVFYAGAAMFLTNIIRGFISRRFLAAAFVFPAAVCVAGGLIAQGILVPWSF